MLKITLLLFAISVNASSAIAPPWVHLANKNCKESESICIDNFRNQELEHLNQFQKHNPQMESSDFLVHECTKQGISTQQGCIKMYKVNQLRPPKDNQN